MKKLVLFFIACILLYTQSFSQVYTNKIVGKKNETLRQP
jgi:hypothetical protein